MAKTPWRCSECGTVNEPVANSCRTCGRWPSLFDLQDSAVGEVEHDATAPAEPGVVGHGPEELESEEFRLDRIEPEPAPVLDGAADMRDVAGREADGARRPGRGARQLVRLVIPIGVLLYVLVTSYLNR